MRRTWPLILGAALALALVPASALALGSAAGNAVTVAKGEVKQGTFFAAGSTVNIEGDIDGDLICAGSSVTISGAVRGDVICAGQTLSITGPVDGSVRVAGQNVTLSGKVGRNVMTAGQTVTATNASDVTGDFGVAAQTATLGGKVAKELYAGAQTLALDGTTGPVWATLETLTLGGQAQVKGNLHYASDQQSPIDRSKVSGSVEYTKQASTQKADTSSPLAYLGDRLVSLANTLVVALVLALLVPRGVRAVVQAMRERTGPSIGWGALALFITPVALVILLVSVIGLGLMFLGAGAWVAALALSTVFVGTALGLWLLDRLKWNANSLVWAAVVGVTALVVIESIPVVGFIIGFVGAMWAMGGVILATAHAQAKS